MATSWKNAPEVREIAERLIPKYHQHLELRADEIWYIFREKATTSKGRVTLGKAHKLGGMACYLIHTSADEINEFGDTAEFADMFVIEIAWDEWQALTTEAREALVDHELEHLDIEVTDSGDLKRSLRGHDVEEFGAILKRHGLWKKDLEHFVEQLNLPGMAKA
jgi:hypothetical protein